MSPTQPERINRPPGVSVPNDTQGARVGEAFSYDANENNETFSDPDGDPLSFSIQLSESLGLSADGTVISGTPTGVGTIVVTITAADPSGSTATDTFEIRIAEDPPALVTTSGTQWLDENEQPLVLKGVNIGNWLLLEFWMMGQSSAQVNDQCTFEQILQDRFGADQKTRLMRLFRDSWISERDWDLLESFGFNTVRLPFIYHLVEDDENPYSLRDDAWDYLDEAIAEAATRNMYVILDLHGAVGSQWTQHTTGCDGQNAYWSNPDYQNRTKWLWEQVAMRYRSNSTVAAYGLLNEPWGTTPDNLASVMVDLYHAIRAVDPNHVIVLPGHAEGIDGYGNLRESGLTNIALEMHFYPGFFGWGQIDYPTHRDWLTCGQDGTGGVCQWADRLNALNVAFLVGEFQPWAGLGALGGPITRATYDTYIERGWATAAWSYKVLSNRGGQGDGAWGLVTNKGRDIEEKLVAMNTWECPGWDTTFDEACAMNITTVTPETTGTRYLVLKAGGLHHLDVLIDDIRLERLSDGADLIVNGGFGSDDGWTGFTVEGIPHFDFQYGLDAPSNSSGPAFRISGSPANGGIYQPVMLEAGKTYTLNGASRDLGSTDAWTEIYLVDAPPQDGVDVVAKDLIPQLDFANASLQDIEELIGSFATVEYEVNEEVRTALTQNQRSQIFDLPSPPTNLVLSETASDTLLNWDAGADLNVTGFNVYRSPISGSSFKLIAENTPLPQYIDTDIVGGRHYYAVSAVTEAGAISYLSNEAVSAFSPHPIPGLIEAESYRDMSGIGLEPTSDSGGGANIAYIDEGDWVDYEIHVETAGAYRVDYRVASAVDTASFNLLIDNVIQDTQRVSNTGDWQAWETQSATIALSEGTSLLRLESTGAGWNMNWLRLTAPEQATGTSG